MTDTERGPALIARASRGKAWGKIFLCLPFAAIGLFLAIAAPVEGPAQLLGGLLAAIFILLMLLQLNLALAIGPQLTIDEVGIFDRRVADRPVPWAEIRGVTELASKNGLRHLFLDVGPKPGRFTERPFKKLMPSINRLPGDGLIINPYGLDVGLADIRAAIGAGLQARR